MSLQCQPTPPPHPPTPAVYLTTRLCTICATPNPQPPCPHPNPTNPTNPTNPCPHPTTPCPHPTTPCPHPPPHPAGKHPANKSCFDRSGQVLAVACDDGKVKAYSTTDGVLQVGAEGGSEGVCECVCGGGGEESGARAGAGARARVGSGRKMGVPTYPRSYMEGLTAWQRRVQVAPPHTCVLLAVAPHPQPPPHKSFFPLRSCAPPQAELAGHEDAVQAVLFDPAGQYLVSCGSDNTFRLWS